jgi:hypothetical protein
VTEVEQLRKELNELRERLVIVEGRTAHLVHFGPPAVRPTFVPETPNWPTQPPYTITCKE